MKQREGFKTQETVTQVENGPGGVIKRLDSGRK